MQAALLESTRYPVAVGIGNDTSAMLHTTLPKALVDAAIRPDTASLAVRFIRVKLPFIQSAIGETSSAEVL